MCWRIQRHGFGDFAGKTVTVIFSDGKKVTADIERPASIRLSYQDLDGGKHSEEAAGLLAVCHQHEIDQLDGIFWIQKLSPLQRDRVIKRYQKRQRLA